METLPENIKLIFLVGAPRSGTTWLQLLLSASPDVATANETHLFSSFFQSLFKSWKTFEGAPARAIGLNQLMSEDIYLEIVREFASKILAKILSQKPGASIILEKTPDHIMFWRDILVLFPTASFLHLIRDPRAVVASLCAASEGWGADWASPSAAENAALWNMYVRAGREIATATPNYYEIRYEQLNRDGVHALRDVFSWCGLEISKARSGEILSNFAIDKLRTGDANDVPWSLSTEPREFYRKGATDGWKADLTRREVRAVERIAQELMVDLCYDMTSGASRTWFQYVAKVNLSLLARVCRGLGWRLQRWGDAL
jgi:hypothetical protein